MTKENKEFNLEDRLIDFAVRILHYDCAYFPPRSFDRALTLIDLIGIIGVNCEGHNHHSEVTGYCYGAAKILSPQSR